MNTARNVIFQVGALIALYASLTALITLLFGIVNILFPDSALYSIDDTSGMRFAIAVLIVTFPTYIILTRFVHTFARKEADALYSTLMKWLLYTSLLIGSVVFLGDVIAIIFTYLNGEITARFLLKALILLVVIGSALLYYFLEVRQYWKENEKKSVYIGIGASVVVVASLIAGFLMIESPGEVREEQRDRLQIEDIQDMTFTVEEYYFVHERMPETLAEAYGEREIPLPPEGRDAYSYRVTDASKNMYELCATFAFDSSDDPYARFSKPDPFFSTEYSEGRSCFTRRVREN